MLFHDPFQMCDILFLVKGYDGPSSALAGTKSVMAVCSLLHLTVNILTVI